MQIALVAYSLRMGGLGRLLLDLGGSLASRGHDVEVLTTEERGDWFDLAATRGIRASFVAGLESRSELAHARLVASALRGHDAVLLNHARHAQLILGALPETTFRAPILHGMDEALVRLATQNPDGWNCLVAPSPDLVRRAEARAPGRPVRLVPHGVHLPAEQEADPRATDATFRVAFVGRLEAAKGVRELPGILNATRARGVSAALEVMGDGPERAWLAREPSLRLHGSVPPEEVASRLARCHALLLPTRAEGLPLAVLEAQAAGCVPLATRLPGVTDFALEEGETGFLFSLGDIDGYAGTLAALARDRDRWSALSAAGRRRVAARFSIAAMAAGYEALLEEHAQGRLPLPRPLRQNRTGVDPRMLRVWDLLPARLRRPLLRAREALRRLT